MDLIKEGILTSLVPRETTQKWIARLNNYIATANSVTAQSSLFDIGQAEVRIHRARELFSILWDIKAMNNWEEVQEQIDRIDRKIYCIRKEKDRATKPGWRRS